MTIHHGNGTSGHGPGVLIAITGNEAALAIDAWLAAHGVHVSGPRTIRANGVSIRYADVEVYVDPSGFVITPEGEKVSGRG